MVCLLIFEDERQPNSDFDKLYTQTDLGWTLLFFFWRVDYPHLWYKGAFAYAKYIDVCVQIQISVIDNVE